MQDTHNFRFEFHEIHGHHKAAGMKDEVETLGKQVDVQAHNLAHPALDPVAFVRFANDLADGEADARTRRQLGARIGGRLRGQKPAHGGGWALAACGIGALVIGVLAQARPSQRQRLCWERGSLGRGVHGSAGLGRTRRAAESAQPGPNRTAVELVAESGADGNALAANGAATAQHGCAALGFHTGAETMSLDALAAIGLKCALGHVDALLFSGGNLRLDGKFQVYRMLAQESSRAQEAAETGRVQGSRRRLVRDTITCGPGPLVKGFINTMVTELRSFTSDGATYKTQITVL